MAIKMRILYSSSKKKMNNIAEAIKAKYELAFNAVDVIPPAYSCDKERIVILGISCKDDLPNKVELFCRELTKARAANVAIICAGDEASVQKTKELLKEAGTNVIENVHNVKISLFNTKVTDEEKTAALNWVKGCVESLN